MSSGATGGGAARDHPPLIATKDTGTGPSVGMSQKAPPYVVAPGPALPFAEGSLTRVAAALCPGPRRRRPSSPRPSRCSAAIARPWCAAISPRSFLAGSLGSRAVSQIAVIDNIKIADKIPGPENVIDRLLTNG